MTCFSWKNRWSMLRKQGSSFRRNSIMERFDLPLSVPFTHRVCFTHDAFAAGNPMLREILAEGGGRRALVYLEEAVAEAWPALPQLITDYLSASCVQLHAIHILPGAEACKADDSLVRHVWDQIEKEKSIAIPTCSASAAGPFSMPWASVPLPPIGV